MLMLKQNLENIACSNPDRIMFVLETSRKAETKHMNCLRHQNVFKFFENIYVFPKADLFLQQLLTDVAFHLHGLGSSQKVIIYKYGISSAFMYNL